MWHLAVGRAEVFSVVGNPLPTSFDAGVDLRDVQIAARHADPRTTMRQSEPAAAWTGTPPTSSPLTWPPAPDPACVSRAQVRETPCIAEKRMCMVSSKTCRKCELHSHGLLDMSF